MFLKTYEPVVGEHLNLYLISQKDKDHTYDDGTYDSAVVCVSSEDEAINMLPGSRKGNGPPTWVTPDNVKAKFLGAAVQTVPHGIVCASFNGLLRSFR